MGIGWVSVWVSVWALQIYDSAILVCDNNLDLMCVFMASGGIGFLPLYWFTMVLACEKSQGTAPYTTKRRGGVFSAHMCWVICQPPTPDMAKRNHLCGMAPDRRNLSYSGPTIQTCKLLRCMSITTQLLGKGHARTHRTLKHTVELATELPLLS